MTSIRHPKWTYVAHVDLAADRAKTAVNILRNPLPIPVDRGVVALAQARQALVELDKADNWSRYVPQAAIDAARTARNELNVGISSLGRGPAFGSAASHFQSTVNWLNVSRNMVVTDIGHEPTHPPKQSPMHPPVTILPLPFPQDPTSGTERILPFPGPFGPTDPPITIMPFPIDFPPIPEPISKDDPITIMPFPIDVPQFPHPVDPPVTILPYPATLPATPLPKQATA